MRNDYTTGIPSEEAGLPLMLKIRSLIKQDVALAEGRRMQGFAARQSTFGFRQPGKFIQPPEVSVGALMDLGS